MVFKVFNLMNFVSAQVKNIQCLQVELQWLLEEMTERLEAVNDHFPLGSEAPGLRQYVNHVYQNATGTWLHYLSFKNPHLYKHLQVEIQHWIAQGFPSATHLPLALENNVSPYAQEIQKLGLSHQERLVVLLALYPHIQPDLLDMCLLSHFFDNALIGGKKSSDKAGFLPTGETALFLLGGDDLMARNQYRYLFDSKHVFTQKGILSLAPVAEGEPKMSGTLVLSDEYLHRFLHSTPYEPQFSPEFPAQKINTDMTWDDIVLPSSAEAGIKDLLLWIRHYHELMQNKDFAKERKGYKCLMYGEPGTGKTMTVNVLSQETDHSIYRISLDQLIHKHGSEATKNLAKIFRLARNHDWILFFDEGDALFSKRSTPSHLTQDTLNSQDISYLLQEIEDYPGIIIVATNNLSSMDEALLRRFETIIHFREPNEQLRHEMWQQALKPFKLNHDINLQEIARKYKKNGEFIKKIKHYLGIRALSKGNMQIDLSELEEAINLH